MLFYLQLTGEISLSCDLDVLFSGRDCLSIYAVLSSLCAVIKFTSFRDLVDLVFDMFALFYLCINRFLAVVKK